MLKITLGAVLFICLPLIGSAAPTQQDDSVLWADSTHRLATFISGPVLTAVERNSEEDIPRHTPLPLAGAQEAKRGIEALLKETLDGLAAHPGLEQFCPHQNEGIGINLDPLQPKSTSFAELIQRRDIAVIGSVERTVAGLYLASTEVATHIVLRIDEVLRDASHSVHAGQTVSFLRIGGTLSYKGTLLCTRSGAQHLPAAGEHLLVIGDQGYWEPKPETMYPRWLFVVENGNVLPDVDAHPYLADSAAKPLAVLRSELAAKNASHE